MKTVFGIFREYQKANEAVEALRQERVPEESMNAVVQFDVAKGSIDFPRDKAGVAVSGKIGDKTARGMNLLVASQPPIPVGDVGNVLASGELATQMAKTASSHEAGGAGALEDALQAFGLPHEKAEEYTGGVAGGGVLFVAKVDDKIAEKTISLLRNHQMDNLTIFPAA